MSQSPAPSTTTSSPQTAAPAPSPATAPRASTYAVGAIPAFKPPVNYAAAASKSKPSPPAINGSDVQAAVIGSQSPATPAAQAIAAVAGAASGSSPTQASSAAGFNNSAANNRRQGQVDAVNVPASRVGTLKSGAADCKDHGDMFAKLRAFANLLCLQLSTLATSTTRTPPCHHLRRHPRQSTTRT